MTDNVFPEHDGCVYCGIDETEHICDGVMLVKSNEVIIKLLTAFEIVMQELEETPVSMDAQRRIKDVMTITYNEVIAIRNGPL